MSNNMLPDNSITKRKMANKFHSEDLSKFSFLITGGSGFIGSNLVEYLIENNAGKVRVLDNLLTSSRINIEKFIGLPNFEFIEGDIRDLTAIRHVKDFRFPSGRTWFSATFIKRSLLRHILSMQQVFECWLLRDANVKQFGTQVHLRVR
jgi:hypothetical protein